MPESFETYQIVRDGDLVFRFTDLQNDQKSLRSGLVRQTGIITSAYVAATPAEVEPRFAAYLMRSYDTTKVFYGMGSGVRQSLKYSDLARVPILMPPRVEQTQIADFLDRETARIDTLIEKQEKLIETLGERRAALITEIATKGLGTFNRRTARSPFLGDVPSGWGESRLGLEMRINAGQVDPTLPPWSEMVLVAPNHIESGTGRMLGRETAAEQGAESGKYVVAPGQLMYSKIRPALNKVALAEEDCLCSADMYAMSPISSELSVRYALYYMLSQPIHAYASTISSRVKMPKVNREELSAAPFLKPPLTEQIEIADFLDEKTSTIDVLIGKARELVDLARERRFALITAAVTGQIDVTEDADG